MAERKKRSSRDFTRKDAIKMMKEFDINPDVVPVKVFLYGMNVELEHGTRIPVSNITDDDITMTTQIVIAHLLEAPDYYQRLKRMEKTMDKYWEGKRKPKIWK